jgi:hypothetical protein
MQSSWFVGQLYGSCASNFPQTQVPTLVPAVKDMNLLLGAFGLSGDVEKLQNAPGHPIGQPDATWMAGVARFVDNTSLAIQ